MDDFGFFWSSLHPRQKRMAEESALLNWDNPEILKFAKYRHDCLNRKKTLRFQYGHPYARFSIETGIVLTEEELENLSESDHLLDQFLFKHPLYHTYVLRCAQRICATPPASEELALAALKIYHRVMGSKEPPRCPDLLNVMDVSFFSNAEKMILRLVSRSVSSMVKNHMQMRIKIMDQMICVPLSFTVEDLRKFFNMPNAMFVRYGRFGPILREGEICQVGRSDIFLKD